MRKIYDDIDHKTSPSEEFKQALSSLPKDLVGYSLDGFPIKSQECRRDYKDASGEVTPLQHCVNRWGGWGEAGRVDHLQLLLDHGWATEVVR